MVDKSKRSIKDRWNYFFKDFLPATLEEWKKATKPKKDEVVSLTILVIIVSFGFAAFLYVSDIAVLVVLKWIRNLVGLAFG